MTTLLIKNAHIITMDDHQREIPEGGLFNSSRPDIVLMDIQMPKMGGLEAIQRLRADPAFNDMPIIAHTALAIVGEREFCLKANATEYMSKPVSLKALRGMIETFLVDRK